MSKNENPDLVVHACDYAQSAVEVVKVSLSRHRSSPSLRISANVEGITLGGCLTGQPNVPRSRARERGAPFFRLGSLDPSDRIIFPRYPSGTIRDLRAEGASIIR